MRPQKGEHYSGYSSLKTLEQHSFVRKEKKKGAKGTILLTSSGRECAVKRDALESEAEKRKGADVPLAGAAAMARAAAAALPISALPAAAPAEVSWSCPCARCGTERQW